MYDPGLTFEAMIYEVGVLFEWDTRDMAYLMGKHSKEQPEIWLRNVLNSNLEWVGHPRRGRKRKAVDRAKSMVFDSSESERRSGESTRMSQIGAPTSGSIPGTWKYGTEAIRNPKRRYDARKSNRNTVVTRKRGQSDSPGEICPGKCRLHFEMTSRTQKYLRNRRPLGMPFHFAPIFPCRVMPKIFANYLSINIWKTGNCLWYLQCLPPQHECNSMIFPEDRRNFLMNIAFLMPRGSSINCEGVGVNPKCYAGIKWCRKTRTL